MDIRWQQVGALLPNAGAQRAALFCAGGEGLQVVVVLVEVWKTFVGGEAARGGFDWLAFANPRGC